MNLKKRSFLKNTVSHCGQISAKPNQLLVKTGYALNIFGYIHLFFRAHLLGNANRSTGKPALLISFFNELISPLLFNADGFLSPDKNKCKQFLGIGWMINVGYTRVSHHRYTSFR